MRNGIAFGFTLSTPVFRLSVALVFGFCTLVARGQAPASLQGKVISVVISGTTIKRESATFDATHTYFTEQDIPEPYSYQVLGANQFRVVNFDPQHPTVAWSHLRFTFTHGLRGIIYDEDEKLSVGEFQMDDAVAPVLSLVRQGSSQIILGVRGLRGQLIQIEESLDGTSWVQKGKYVLKDVTWEMPMFIAPKTPRLFIRAVTPTP